MLRPRRCARRSAGPQQFLGTCDPAAGAAGSDLKKPSISGFFCQSEFNVHVIVWGCDFSCELVWWDPWILISVMGSLLLAIVFDISIWTYDLEDVQWDKHPFLRFLSPRWLIVHFAKACTRLRTAVQAGTSWWKPAQQPGFLTICHPILWSSLDWYATNMYRDHQRPRPCADATRCVATPPSCGVWLNGPAVTFPERMNMASRWLACQIGDGQTLFQARAVS